MIPAADQDFLLPAKLSNGNLEPDKREPTKLIGVKCDTIIVQGVILSHEGQSTVLEYCIDGLYWIYSKLG